jgi:2-haloalkanoic acid dehalogenase type II
MIKCIVFDCFGTVFDMRGVSRDEIRAYVDHVRRNDFTPFTFPDSWWSLPPHPDAATGISLLQNSGFRCVALSNGGAELIGRLSKAALIRWDTVIDLVKHQVYKPHVGAYRTVEKETGFKPDECLMVTANPTFGDIEGAESIGMQSQIIRNGGSPNTIIELADLL